jgi:hypothetical protein
MLVERVAEKSAIAAIRRTGRENFWRRAAMSPPPVTIPTRAHMLCTPAIKGQVSGASQSSPVPNCAPAIE